MEVDSTAHFKKQFGDAIRRNSKIDAIKVWRTWKNIGLFDASQYIQKHWDDLRLLHSTGGE